MMYLPISSHQIGRKTICNAIKDGMIVGDILEKRIYKKSPIYVIHLFTHLDKKLQKKEVVLKMYKEVKDTGRLRVISLSFRVRKI